MSSLVSVSSCDLVYVSPPFACVLELTSISSPSLLCRFIYVFLHSCLCLPVYVFLCDCLCFPPLVCVLFACTCSYLCLAPPPSTKQFSPTPLVSHPPPILPQNPTPNSSCPTIIPRAHFAYVPFRCVRDGEGRWKCEKDGTATHLRGPTPLPHQPPRHSSSSSSHASKSSGVPRLAARAHLALGHGAAVQGNARRMHQPHVQRAMQRLSPSCAGALRDMLTRSDDSPTK